jgi:hypothetical protein
LGQVVRFFDRKEFYTVVGENALFVARCASRLFSNRSNPQHTRHATADEQGRARGRRVCRERRTCRG